MLETRLGERAVEFQARRIVWKLAILALAKPRHESSFLRDREQREVLFACAERQFLAARLPAEFFDEQLGQVPASEQRAGGGEFEGHGFVHRRYESFHILLEKRLLVVHVAASDQCGFDLIGPEASSPWPLFLLLFRQPGKHVGQLLVSTMNKWFD